MTFKIWHKLALLLIVTITFSVLISTGLSQLSFKNSFEEYVEQQEQREQDSLAANLLLGYEKNSNWDFIRNKRRVWFYYLRLKPDFSKTTTFQEDEHRFRKVLRQERQAIRQERNLIRAMPAQSRGFKGNKRRSKVALVDHNKQHIVGAVLSEENAEYFPLTSDGRIVAYIQRARFAGITDQLDKIFARKQDQAFIYNALSTVFISVLVAIFISIYFRKRMSVLTRIARELTSGNYQQRVEIKQKDELGQLGMDFNSLAITLQKNQQSQQQWIADISHELRTPIAILKGELQALDDGIRPLKKEAIQSLTQEIERLNKLVEDLYQLSIADMGALKYEKKPFLLDEFFNEIEENFSLLFVQQNIKFSIDYKLSEQFQCLGDRQRLYQLMSNLLQNSLRYTDAGGQVNIKGQVIDNNIELSISDSVPGVPHDKLEQIFERLYRVDTSRSRSSGGSGLGLAIAKQIVLAHEGKIYARISASGGLSITILLPMQNTENRLN